MKRYKEFFIGFLVASMIFSCIGAFAEVNPIEAFTSEIIIRINGVKLDAQPINYNGSTYLPLRTVAEALSKEVVYHKETKSVDIYDKKESGTTTSTATKELNTTVSANSPHFIEIGDIDPLIPLPDQSKVPKDVDINDHDFIYKTEQIRSYISANPDNMPVNPSCIYKGKAYYEFNLDYWFHTRYPNNQYNMTWVTLNPDTNCKKYIVLYDGSFYSERGAIRAQRYAKEDDLLTYKINGDLKIVIKYDLIMDLISQAGIELPAN